MPAEFRRRKPGSPPLNLLNEALSQEQRQREAPMPERVAVDGRGAAELLAFASDYGRHVTFYDLQDRPAGNWAGFFASDPAIAAAAHAALDLEGIAGALRDRLDRLREADAGPGSLPSAAGLLADITRLIDILDRIHLADPDLERALRRITAEARQDRLAEPLRRLGELLREGGLDGALKADLSGPIRHWNVSVGEQLEDLLDLLVAELKERCAEAQSEMEAALKAGGHPPQAALYAAFVQLFLDARAALNRFPDRLVDFYFGDILGEASFPPTPDHTFLTFARAEGVDQASVPRGTRFSVGTDENGEPIEYAATTSLEVTGATVQEISVHRMARPTDVGTGGLASAAAYVLRGTVDLSGDGAGRLDSVPLFGWDVLGADASGALRMERSDLGLCISGPVLMLRGGQRRVQIGFEISGAYRSRLHAVSGELREPGDFGALIERLVEAVRKRLALFYTTAGGWVLVRSLEVSPGLILLPEESASSIVVSFTLPPDAPPLVPLSERADAGAPAPDRPAEAFAWQPPGPSLIASLSLQPEEQDEAARLLDLIRFEEVSVDVDVAGLTELGATTPNGVADMRRNFALFGLPPVRNASLSIAGSELFVKRLDRLSIAIEWAGLPVTNTGFAGYYHDYRIDADGFASPAPLFDNQSFRVRFRVINPGFWSVDETEPSYLFRTDETETPAPAAALAQCTVLTPAVAAAEGSRDYYDPGKSALSIVLDAPAYAFGHDLYPANLVAASHEQGVAAGQRAMGRPAPAGRSSSQRLGALSAGPAVPVASLPNAPWVPMAAALSLGYSASASRRVSVPADTEKPGGASVGPAPPAGSDLELWHVSPFGVFKPLRASPRNGAALLPVVQGQAALYIQLSAPVPQISLLFILSLTDEGWREAAPEVRWEEHVGGRWVPVRVLSDTTSGLKGSGIVTLELTVVEGQAKAPRIRALVEKNFDNAPHLEGVIANALTAQWVGPGGASTRGQPLSQGTISKSDPKLAGIAAIDQPMQSVGGAPPATGCNFRMRMAERLRHKNEAITAWDYARLALTVQPSLWQAAVVPASDAGGIAAAGKVWLVAVGGPGTPNVADPTVPMVDLATLANLGETLSARAGPFVDMVLTNPPYVRQQVVATVDFSDDDSGAAWGKRLERELIAWLSPWPDPRLGPRPADYYQLHAVADFIRSRPYVRGIRSCELDIEQTSHRWAYLTSATSHRINEVKSSAGRPLQAAQLRG